MRGKRVIGAMLGAVLTVTASITAWALPTGLSVIDGRTVRSTMAGFEVAFPDGYEVSRDMGYGLGAMDYYMEENGTRMDFVASVVDGENESFMINMGIVISRQQADLNADMEELKQMVQQEPSYAPYVSFGYADIAGSGYASVKINYGALMSAYMSQWMDGYEMTPEERQTYEAYIAQMSVSMFADLYIRQVGENYYVLTQVYSGDQAGSAAYILGQMHPYAGGGWSYGEGGGWQYVKADGSYGANEWALDENGLTYRLDANGRIAYSAWVDEGGRWKYVDEFGHMVTNITKTIDGVQYTFDSQGYMVEGSERTAVSYETGVVSGQAYSNRWANLLMKFPDTAQLILGDGSAYSYPLEAGENMYYWYNDGSGYLLTLDYADSTQQLDRYLEMLIEYAAYFDYTVDSTGTVNMGGYEYKAVKTSRLNSDGTTDHEDTYFRQIDGKRMEIAIEYTGDRQASVDQILAAIQKLQ